MSEDPKTPIANSFWNKINSKARLLGRDGVALYPSSSILSLHCALGGGSGHRAGLAAVCSRGWIPAFRLEEVVRVLTSWPWARHHAWAEDHGQGQGLVQVQLSPEWQQDHLTQGWCCAGIHPPASAWVLPSGSFGWNGNGAEISHGHGQAASSTSSGVKGRSC